MADDKNRLISNSTASDKQSLEFNDRLDDLSPSGNLTNDPKENGFISKSALQQALLTAIRSSMVTKENTKKRSCTEFSELLPTSEPDIPLNKSEPDPDKFHSGTPSQENLSNPEETLEFHRTKWQTFCEYMRQFTGSWVMVGILVAMLVWPCSYIYMGLMYLLECNFLIYFPVMFLFMGVSGIAAIFSRIVRNILKKYPRMFPLGSCSFCRYLTNLGVLIFAAVFCVELLVLAGTPGQPTESPGPLHCDPVFYSFSKSNVWVVIVLGLLLLALYLPPVCGGRVPRDPILPEGIRERHLARMRSFVKQYEDSNESNES